MQRRGKKAETVAPGTLGNVQRLIGIFQQVFNLKGIVGIHRDTDAGRDKCLPAVELEHRPEGVQQFLQNTFNVQRGLQFGQQHGKFIAAHERHGIDFAQAVPDALRCLHQQLVALVVPKRVIDFLEVVQVNEQHRQLQVVAAAFLELLRQPLLHQAPVGQPGELIKMGLLPDRCLGRLAFGDVGVGANHAQRPALVIAADNHAARQHPLPAAVLATHPVFVAVTRCQSGKVGLMVMPDPRHIIGVGALVHLVVFVGYFTGRKTIHAQQTVGGIFFAFGNIPVPQPVSDALHRQLPAGLVFQQRGLGQLALGDVLHNGRAMHRPVVLPGGGSG
ncbi:hypothetical protein GALL_439030 [mine drainage metagenome]|uniref:Uncharacterized protein n=1 Tax=mine drainage metagenome TaxID=410659 RepID=A0A1J5PSH7_9ZZZZ